MDSLTELPIWGAALVIFFLRIVDVSLGTFRTIAVVQGRTVTSVVLGFLEVLVWITTVSQVMKQAGSNPTLLLAYAAGFAAGNAVGILLERRLALGGVILRMVTATKGDELAGALREKSPRVYTFRGEGRGEQESEAVTLIYVVALRRRAKRLLKRALAIDPNLFYAVDPLRDSNADLGPTLPPPTAWRSWVKKK